MRLESDFILFSAAAETAGCFYWVPGALRAFQWAAPNDTTGITLQPIGVPGAAFLVNYSTARAVSACVQVMYPGAELNRSGIVGMGLVPGGQLTNIIQTTYGGAGGSSTVGQIRSSCQIVERTPSTMMEIRLRPGDQETRPTDIAALSQDQTEFPEAANGKNGFIIVAAGLPEATGIRIRCVCTYELTPLSNQGMVSGVETTRSVNTEKDVVQALDAANEKWWHSTPAAIAYHTLGAAATAATAYYSGGNPEAVGTALGVWYEGNELRKR